jgi:hypothetical protein
VLEAGTALSGVDGARIAMSLQHASGPNGPSYWPRPGSQRAKVGD